MLQTNRLIMVLYSDIIAWANTKAPFIKDAVRRLLCNPSLTQRDFLEIKDLLKKEHRFDNITLNPCAATETDIPTEANQNNQVKLLQIASPHNISALYESTSLNFDVNGLSIIYGKNGSGKSSFSKILKKICWSRDNAVVLKKNIYTSNTDEQSVFIKYLEGDVEKEFVWREGQNTDQKLNSIYVFDSKCANIYLNQENPAEYKPLGIDILERLLSLFNELQQSINDDIQQLQSAKIEIGDKYHNTDIFKWYQCLENHQREDIVNTLVFTEEQKCEQKILEVLLKDTNPEETNKILQHKQNRYQKLFDELETIEKLFDTEKLKNITHLQQDFLAKEKANHIARLSYEDGMVFSIEGHAWKTLWDAAKAFATTELQATHPIASNDGKEYCVLCQQPLSMDAKERLRKFESYIQDATSTALNLAQKKLDDERKIYNAIPDNFIDNETTKELIEDNQSFAAHLTEYFEQLINARQKILHYIDKDKQVNDISTCTITHSILPQIRNEIINITKRIQTNKEIIENRLIKEQEYLELQARHFLVQNKETILKYYDEYIIKKKYEECKSSLNTRNISTKIGELLESKAIEAQQTLFLQYLNIMNPQIAAKIKLKKTRTTSGITYQKCSFNSISENVSEILSEGEQKIVAIANFLAECTIDDAKNAIVFDDPINSLDLDYREAVANIIVQLSGDRQIIVLTHDLYFLRLLKDKYKREFSSDCYVTCINSLNGKSGIVSDEIPYLAKNIQERINTITAGISNLQQLDIALIDKRNSIINDLKDKMRQLLERTVEEILVNKTISRFSKNISFKRSDLANLIIVEKEDIDFLLTLYGKYSEVIHDGSIETIPNTLTENDIHLDITNYRQWKDSFIGRAKNWKKANGYDC